MLDGWEGTPGASRTPQELKDRATAAVAGAFIGDACGSVMTGHPPNPGELREGALRMAGGGVYGQLHGQVGCCGELAMTLADAIVRSLAGEVFSARSFAHEIKKGYRRWLETRPPQPSRHIAEVLEARLGRIEDKEEPHSAFGSTMRASPLAVWLADFYRSNILSQRNMVLDGVVCASVLDATTTTSDPSAIIASAAYTTMLTHLIAMDRTESIASDAIAAGLEAAMRFPNMFSSEKKDVLGWFAMVGSDAPYRSKPEQDYSRHAIMNTCSALRQTISFSAMLDKTLSAGGDVDINATTCMAIFGAFVGLKNIDRVLIEGLNTADLYVRGGVDFTSNIYQDIVDVLLKVKATAADIKMMLATATEVEALSSYLSMWGEYER